MSIPTIVPFLKLPGTGFPKPIKNGARKTPPLGVSGVFLGPGGYWIHDAIPLMDSNICIVKIPYMWDVEVKIEVVFPHFPQNGWWKMMENDGKPWKTLLKLDYLGVPLLFGKIHMDPMGTTIHGGIL